MSTFNTVAPLPPQASCIGYELFKPDISPVVDSFTVPTNYRLFAATVAPTADDGTVGDWWQFFDALLVKVYQKTTATTWTLQTTIGDIPTPTSQAIYSQTTEVTVANTAAETTLVSSGSGTTSVTPAIGTTYRISLAGIYSSDNTGTTTLTLSFTINTQAMVNCILTIPQNKTNGGWEAHMLVTCKDNGSGGIIGKPQGRADFQNTAAIVSGFGVATLNRTMQNGPVNVTATWSAASALNTITVSELIIETLRQ